MNATLDAKFAPDMEFISLVARACKEILHDKMSREKILSRYLLLGRNRKERDKLFKYIQSIVKDRIILDYMLSRIHDVTDKGLRKTEDTYFIKLCIIFHVFEDRIVKRRFLPFTDDENDKIRESLKKVLAETGPEMQSLVEDLLHFNMEENLAGMDMIDYFSILYSHPSFLIAKLLEMLPRPRIHEILNAHQSSDKFFIVTSDDAALKRIKNYLLEKGFTFQEDRALPSLLHIPNIGGWKNDLLDRVLKAEKNAMIQDFGSVATIEALGIQPGDKIIDGCAAPFQKTINMSWHCGPWGRIIAFDAHERRTTENARRLDKNDRKIIHVVNADATRMHLTCRNFQPDKVLLDVPCTGSGSLGAYPELKDRQNEDEIKNFVQLQREIVSSVIEACATNKWMDTEIVYSTCSYYPEEGEALIDSFWNEVTMLDLHDPNGHGTRTWQLPHGWGGYRCSRFVARTFPDMNNGSKAFFIAKFAIAPKT